MAYSSYDAAKKAADKYGGSVGYSKEQGGWHIVGGTENVGTLGPTSFKPTYKTSGSGGTGYGMGAGYTTPQYPVNQQFDYWTGGSGTPSWSTGGTSGAGITPTIYPNTEGFSFAGQLGDAANAYLQKSGLPQVDPKTGKLNYSPVSMPLSEAEMAEAAALMGGSDSGFAGMGVPSGAVQVVPPEFGMGAIFRMPNGTFVNEAGQVVDPATAQYIIDLFRGNTGGQEEEVAPFDPGMTEWQQAQMDMQAQQLGWEQEYAQMQMAWQQEQQQWQREQARMQQEIQRANLDLAQQQIAAQLAAQPASWLEYSAFMGEAPKVQPWMLPLMPQQYQSLQPGDEIPGWSETDMSEMPELVTPSQQYLARMGPSALQQYYAYLWALSGKNPEESDFRFESFAPPGGQNAGLYQYK